MGMADEAGIGRLMRGLRDGAGLSEGEFGPVMVPVEGQILREPGRRRREGQGEDERDHPGGGLPPPASRSWGAEAPVDVPRSSSLLMGDVRRRHKQCPSHCLSYIDRTREIINKDDI